MYISQQSRNETRQHISVAEPNPNISFLCRVDGGTASFTTLAFLVPSRSRV